MKNKLCKTIIYSNTIAVDTMGLMQALNCVKIGTDAGAKIQIGKRVLWSMSKIRKFVDELAE